MKFNIPRKIESETFVPSAVKIGIPPDKTWSVNQISAALKQTANAFEMLTLSKNFLKEHGSKLFKISRFPFGDENFGQLDVSFLSERPKFAMIADLGIHLPPDLFERNINPLYLRMYFDTYLRVFFDNSEVKFILASSFDGTSFSYFNSDKLGCDRLAQRISIEFSLVLTPRSRSLSKDHFILEVFRRPAPFKNYFEFTFFRKREGLEKAKRLEHSPKFSKNARS